MSHSAAHLRISPLAVVVAGAAIFALSMQVAAFYDLRFDDAYITFRYGQNLALGRGLVFNPGERLLGTTSPGHALLAALVYAMAGLDRTPGIMSAIGCIGWTAQAVLLFELLRRRAGLWVAGLAGGLLAAGAAGSWTFVALETNLVSAAVLGALVLGQAGRWRTAGLLAAVACVLRLDATLAALALAWVAYRVEGRRSLYHALPGVAVLLTWLGFATVYYGSPWPHTLRAKLHQTPLGEYAIHAVKALPGAFVPNSTVAVFVLWPVAIHGAYVLWRREPRWAGVLLVWALLHLAIYVVLRPGVLFSWHLYPAVIVFVTAVATSAAVLIERVRLALVGPLGVAIVALATAGIVSPYAYGTIRASVDHPTAFWLGGRDEAYRTVAKILRSVAAPGDLVDAEEVGTLAYWSDLKMTDHPELVSRRNREFGHHLFVDGKPTHLRWLVLNDKTIQSHRSLVENKPVLELNVGGWKLWIADFDPARRADRVGN